MSRYALFSWMDRLSQGGWRDLSGTSDELSELVTLINNMAKASHCGELVDGHIVDITKGVTIAFIMNRCWRVTTHVGTAKEVRYVYVPLDQFTGDLRHDLEIVFYYGQNDFMLDKPSAGSTGKPSLSVGDVVHLYHDSYRVASFGFDLIED